MPWNQGTLLGYSGEIASIMIFSVTFFLLNGLFLLLFISLCKNSTFLFLKNTFPNANLLPFTYQITLFTLGIYHETFYEIVDHAKDEFNRTDENRCNDKFLGDLIRFHASIKEWVCIKDVIYLDFTIMLFFFAFAQMVFKFCRCL